MISPVCRLPCCTPPCLARGGSASPTWPSTSATTWASYTGNGSGSELLSRIRVINLDSEAKNYDLWFVNKFKLMNSSRRIQVANTGVWRLLLLLSYVFVFGRFWTRFRVLLIRIRIGSVFRSFLDQYSEYGSGSTHANIGWNWGKICKI